MDTEVINSSKAIDECLTSKHLVPSSKSLINASTAEEVHQASDLEKFDSRSNKMICRSIHSFDSTLDCILTKTRKETTGCHSLDPVVKLLRLPSWISILKTVQISQECVVPTTEKLSYKSLSCLTKLTNKRLTRSVGATLDMRCNIKLPDFRTQRQTLVDHEYGPFFGFNPEETFFLSNNDVFQFLSDATEKIDYISKLAVSDLNPNRRCIKRSYPSGKKKREKMRKERKRKSTKNKDTRLIAGTRIPQDGQNICGKDFCRLGCVCKSLRGNKKLSITRCAHEECMFSSHADGCLQGFNGAPNRVVRLLLSNQSPDSPVQDLIPVKRIRKPPKRWLVEEEECGVQSLIKKKPKVNPQVSLMTPRVRPGSETGIASKLNFYGARLKCMEHDRLNCHCLFDGNLSSDLSAIKNLPDKDIVGKIPSSPMSNQSVSFDDEMNSTSWISASSSGGSHVSGTVAVNSNSLSNQDDNSSHSRISSNKPKVVHKIQYEGTILRRYFRNRKNFSLVSRSNNVSDEDLESMCRVSLAPLSAKSIIIMKWAVLEKLITERLAYLWVSQAPKCVARMYVTEDCTSPGFYSFAFDVIPNVFSKSSSTEYFFNFWRSKPHEHGCCILTSHGLFWEICGNLDLRTRNEHRCHVRVSKYSKGATERKPVLGTVNKSIVYGGTRVKWNCSSDVKRSVEGEKVELSESELSIVDEIARTDNQNNYRKESGGNPLNTTASDDRLKLVQERKIQRDTKQHMPSSAQSVAHLDLFWYRLFLSKLFDKLTIKNPMFVATYSQLTSALRISKNNSMPVKILFNHGITYKFDGKAWSQGIYADFTECEKSVLIGPYFEYENPEIKSFFDVNGKFFYTPVQVIIEQMRKARPNPLLTEQLEDNEVEVSRNVQSTTDSKPIVDSTKLDGQLDGAKKMKNALSNSNYNPSKGSKDCKIDICRVKNVPTIESTTNMKNAMSSTQGNMQANVTTGFKAEHSTSNTDNTMVSLNHNVPDVKHEAPNNAEPDFSIRIESVRGNFAGFDEISSSCTEQSVEKSVATAEICKKSNAELVSGYLIADIPNLMPIAVVKGGGLPEEANKITIMDTLLCRAGMPTCFINVESASIHLQSIVLVKFYPESLTINWAFVRVDSLHKIEKSDGIYHPAELSGNQFITPRGVFSYEGVNAHNFQRYGLKTPDLHRLLEYKRRRVIRNAKNELVSLFPDQNVDSLIRTIEMAYNTIKYLERTSNSLAEDLKAQRVKKKSQLAKLRQHCSGAEMFAILEKLDKMKRPHISVAGEHKSTSQNQPKSPNKPRSKKVVKRRNQAKTESFSVKLKKLLNVNDPVNLKQSCDPKRLTSADKSLNPISATSADKSLNPISAIGVDKTLNPESATNLNKPQTMTIYPVNLKVLPKPDSTTNLNMLQIVRSPANPKGSPGVKSTTNLKTSQTVNRPENPNESPGTKSIMNLNKPANLKNFMNWSCSKYRIYGGPLHSVTKSPKSDAQRNVRKLFSGRLVSSATKKSLRKYNYIMPPCANRVQTTRILHEMRAEHNTFLEDHNYTHQKLPETLENEVTSKPTVIASDVNADGKFAIKLEHHIIDEFSESADAGTYSEY